MCRQTPFPRRRHHDWLSELGRGHQRIRRDRRDLPGILRAARAAAAIAVATATPCSVIPVCPPSPSSRTRSEPGPARVVASVTPWPAEAWNADHLDSAAARRAIPRRGTKECRKLEVARRTPTAARTARRGGQATGIHPISERSIVRRYLEDLESTSHRRRSRRTQASMRDRLAAIDALLPAAPTLNRLQLIQERIDLRARAGRVESAGQIVGVGSRVRAGRQPIRRTPWHQLRGLA